MDGIDLEAAKKHGILVRNTPEAPTEAVAELAVSLILDLLRKVNIMDRNAKAGIWKKEMGALLQGKTIGIVGLGRIGRRVAELLKPFNVTLLATDIKPDAGWISKNNVKLAALEELLKQSDIVSIHVPYSKEMHNFMNPEKINSMKKGAILINTSRGGLIDEKALYDALKSGHLGGAGLDVFEKEPYAGPLKEFDNIIITPHIGSYALESRVQMEIEAAKNLVGMLGEKK
jgi:D-3-phosphoglycerate dehydrogenase